MSLRSSSFFLSHSFMYIFVFLSLLKKIYFNNCFVLERDALITEYVYEKSRTFTLNLKRRNTHVLFARN